MYIKVGSLLYRISDFALGEIQLHGITLRDVAEAMFYGEVMGMDGDMTVKTFNLPPTTITLWIDEERLVLVDIFIGYY